MDKIKNNKVYSTILEGSETMEDANELSRTELDSHANMPVIGRNAYILSKIGETWMWHLSHQTTSLSVWNWWMQH